MMSVWSFTFLIRIPRGTVHMQIETFPHIFSSLIIVSNTFESVIGMSFLMIILFAISWIINIYVYQTSICISDQRKKRLCVCKHPSLDIFFSHISTSLKILLCTERKLFSFGMIAVILWSA